MMNGKVSVLLSYKDAGKRGTKLQWNSVWLKANEQKEKTKAYTVPPMTSMYLELDA